jgi:hypothetical protein
MVADYGAVGMSLYGSSKAAINLLTKAWAAEYGPNQWPATKGKSGYEEQGAGGGSERPHRGCRR